MTIKTREEYLSSLRAMRPNIHKFGERIEDVTTHPATRRVVEGHAKNYDAAHDPELEHIYTTTSSLTGEKILRWNSLLRSQEDLLFNMKMKRQNYRRNGTCTGAVCVGWNAASVMWAVTGEIDQEKGTDYQQRLKNWVLAVEKNGLTVAGALTDAKGNRSLPPSRQADPDTTVRVTEVSEDGIVIRGAKLMICGTAAANEIFLLPGGIYPESDQDHVLACAIPRDIEGLTIVETTRPSDRRDLEEPHGKEVPDTGITQAWLMFDDVFVPAERVFMCRDYEYSGKVIQYFTANYRACIGGCVTGQGDVMIGASVLMARANGLSAKTFSGKLTEMSINNQVTWGMGAGAIALGSSHPSGAYFADPQTAHANKVMVATLPYEVKRLTQEIGGGIVETGCMPSYKDFSDPVYGPLIQKYLKAGDCSAESRFKAARLSEWLTIGGGVPGCMHGGGSPDGAKMVVRALTPLEEYAGYAKNLMNIEEEISDPPRNK